jgi:hypothetical protein
MRTGHCITIGQTESGKSILNKRLARNYQRHGIGVVVLDPLRDPDWAEPGASNFVMCKDPDEFLALVKDPDRCLQCALFVDEAGMSINRYAVEYQWLTTMSRHHGHVTHLIAQRAQMISPTIRSQCRTCFAFNVGSKDAKEYAQDFNCDMLLDAQHLAQGEFIRATRFEAPARFRLWK